MALEAKQDGVHKAFNVQRGMMSRGTVARRAQPSPDGKEGSPPLEALGRKSTVHPRAQR